MIKNKAKSNIQMSPHLMDRMIEKLKEEVFCMSKKLQLIKRYPNEMDQIFKMDKVMLIQRDNMLENEIIEEATPYFKFR